MKVSKRYIGKALLGMGCVLSAMLIGVSAAFLLFNTNIKKNDFEFKNAKIELTETAWDNLDDDAKVVYPNRTVSKNPVIQNVGDVDVYAYIEVTVPRQQVRTLSGETIVATAWTDLFTYAVNSGWTQIGTDEVSTDNTSVKRIYAYTAQVLAPEETSNSLFDAIQFANVVEGEVAMDTKLEVKVDGVAIQSQYLKEEGDTMAEKMESAYALYLEEVARR